MSSDNPDVIVIGAGMAGLCCAGELVLEGMKPLLICETKEIGAAVRSIMVDGNRGMMQVPTWQTAWDGGWWPSVIRRLNVPITVPDGFGPLDYAVSLRGSKEKLALPQCALSGEALADAILKIFPLFAEAKPELSRVLCDALAIPYLELVEMHRVRITDWLQERKAGEVVTQILLALSSAMTASTTAFCHEHLSAYATIGYLRSFFCGEASYGMPYPDIREGLLIPLGKEIERRGGKVWRGRKVARINMEGGRVGSVVMEDGTEVSAPMVAIATGNNRIPALLKQMPPEIQPVMDYSKVVEHRNFNVFTVLNKPLVPKGSLPWAGVLDPQTGSLIHWIHNIHIGVPWAVKKPGTQFVTAGLVLKPEEVDSKYGGDDGVFEHLHNLLEEYYPGYKAAIETTERLTHQANHLWYGNCTVGPKLPRTIKSVEGLWFVGEGSVPFFGTYMEAATSAGMMGARDMASVLRTSR